jgi:hypothetical protein
MTEEPGKFLLSLVRYARPIAEKGVTTKSIPAGGRGRKYWEVNNRVNTYVKSPPPATHESPVINNTTAGVLS